MTTREEARRLRQEALAKKEEDLGDIGEQFTRLLTAVPTPGSEVARANEGFLSWKSSGPLEPAKPTPIRRGPPPSEHPWKRKFDMNKETREDLFAAVQQLWDDLVVRGRHNMQPEEIRMLAARKHPFHVCTVTGNCNVLPLHVVVYMPREYVDRDERHVCLPSLCNLAADAAEHNKANIALRYSKFYGCTVSGLLHHCVDAKSHGPTFPLKRMSKTEVTCPISTTMFLDNVVLEQEEEKKGQAGTEISVYAMEHKERRIERRMLESAGLLKSRFMGTALPLATELPSKDQFENECEFALFKSRTMLWRMFFSYERVAEVMCHTVESFTQSLMETSMLKGENTEGILFQGGLDRIAMRYLQKVQPYFPAVNDFDLVDRHRFVNFYALCCFYVWCYVRENWNQVVLYQNEKTTRQTMRNTAAGTEAPILATDDALQRKQIGEMILPNCTMGLLRIMQADKNTGLHGVFSGHRHLVLLMPVINGIEKFEYMIHSATQAQTCLREFFTQITQAKRAPLETLISYPATTFEEVRALPRDAVFNEVADAEMVRRFMESKLIVKPTMGMSRMPPRLDAGANCTIKSLEFVK